jgi:deoxyribodipyrimidine photo-lyase
MIQKERIKVLNTHDNDAPVEYVLYWMQASQRIMYNHALAHAINVANEHKLPLMVCFGLSNKYPEANIRHYTFMLEGIKELSPEFKKRGITFIVAIREPADLVIELSRKAKVLICDHGYTNIQILWRKEIAKKAFCPVVQVETDLIVPVEEASQKEEYSAATIRPKIKSAMTKYLSPLSIKEILNKKPCKHDIKIIDLEQTTEKILSKLDIDNTVPASKMFKGGTKQALKLLEELKTKKLKKYSELKNDPSLDHVSHLSPYIHFGQISTLQIALELKNTPEKDNDSFLEELIVRRELAFNFVYYNNDYDNYKCLPEWAKKTLDKHKKDKRSYLYSLKELEQAKTHDVYWNTAQKQMLVSGKMHGYMRMYWGKKIIEWSKTPEEAYKTALYLNNKYELDGRDPNGFAGIAWCFGKHDRPWIERSIFGTVRYMNDKGLERKFDMKKYIKNY